MFCYKCGDDVPASQFQKDPFGRTCDDCWQTYDMGRHQEAPRTKPKKRTRAATVTHLSNGKLGVLCPAPGCGHKVMRSSNYYTRHYHYERCAKCMERYFVRREDCERHGSPDSASE